MFVSIMLLSNCTSREERTMQDTRSPGELEPNAPEGWIVEDLADYQFLVGHDPPRPGSFLRQVKEDFRSRIAYRCWAGGGWLIVLGLLIFLIGAQQGWLWLALSGLALALFGALWLSYMLRQFLVVVRMLRRGPLVLGEICSLRPHPVNSDLSVAEARLADGRSLPVAVPTAPAAALLGRDSQAEVLLVAALDQRLGGFIGIRAMPRDRGAGAAGMST
jgi:hypothetical protein